MNNIKTVKVAPIIFILTTWLISVSWRPFLFGFYHDDWSTINLPIDSTPLIQLLSDDITRPIYVLIIYALRLIFGPNAFVWQAFDAIINLVCSLSIYMLFVSVMKSPSANDFSVRIGGGGAAILWLLFPWAFGYSAWPIMSPPMIGMALTCIGLSMLFLEEAKTSYKIFGAVFVVLAWLIYEAFWFVWVPFAVISFLRELKNKNIRRQYLISISILGLMQTFAILLNRVLSSVSKASKTFNISMFDTFVSNVELLPAKLKDLLGNMYYLLGLVLIFLIIAAITASYKRKKSIYAFFSCLSLLFGFIGAVLLYSAAGYTLELKGLFSRTMICTSLYLAFFGGVLLQLASSDKSRITRYVSIFLTSIIAIVFFVTSVNESKYWINSWKAQKEIIENLPISMVELLEPDSIVLANIDRSIIHYDTFGAYWDISGLVYTRIKINKAAFNNHAYATVLQKEKWYTTWDGNEVVQYFCDNLNQPLWKLKATKAYIWNYPQPELHLLEKPFKSGCER